MNMHNSAAPILIFVAALGAALVLLVNGRFVGTKLGVLDHPDAVRKIHPQVTPLTIGLAIMAAVIVWAGGTFVWNPTPNSQLLLTVLLCGAGATLVGYIDDQTPISASGRLLFLFLLSAIAIVIEPDLLPSQINWTHFGPLPIAPWFACIFIAVAMAGFVNAVNMADGQNGVVLGMFIIWSACLILTTRGHTQSAALILFGASFISFFFNMAGRAFLGDSGSYGVSFVFGLLAIRAHNHWGVSAETIAVWFFIPVLDCLRLMVTRSLSGGVPTYSDRNHFHHRLQDKVGSRFGLVIYLSAIGTSSIIAALMPRLSLVCMIALAALYFSFAWLEEKVAVEEADLESDARAERFRLVGNSNLVELELIERHFKRD